jgi:Deoxyribonuclease NucA/NucB
MRQPVSSASGTSATVNPNPAGYNECESGNGPAGTYYFEDRFHACFIFHPGVYVVEVIKGVKVVVGEWFLQWTVSLTGSNNSQLMTASVKSRLWKQEGVPAGPLWELVIGISCGNAGNAKCTSNLPSGILNDTATWDLPHEFTFTFDTAASAGNGSSGRYNAKDGLNYHSLTPWQNYPAGNGLVNYAPVSFRCDRASYIISKTAGGCIFSQVMETWDISLSNSSLTEVARHIQRAELYPGTRTVPAPPHGEKVLIPGFASTKYPLTRLYQKYDTTLYRENRATAIRACIARWGRNYSDHNKYQCDEYPFASTYQGASTATGNPWWYSVQVLSTSDNLSAGGSLSAWLSANRILSGDQYWVAVVP